ncbi:hypothetical protein NPIL_303491 [Nephila pilipes]|uniref:Uncharacterized protein n=1 Tax=Nephila pilipes TaxID=299642 RepID=A0A8X6QGS3_NEPPI|nr:hypothetical protein NPIL_303491 [Nephila pilipes]
MTENLWTVRLLRLSGPEQSSDLRRGERKKNKRERELFITADAEQRKAAPRHKMPAEGKAHCEASPEQEDGQGCVLGRGQRTPRVGKEIAFKGAAMHGESTVAVRKHVRMRKKSFLFPLCTHFGIFVFI